MELLGSGFNLLLIIFGFGFLIFVHELGHFWAAKWAGIRTEGFAIGMGWVVLAWRKGMGFSIGSTEKRVVKMTGKPSAELTDDELKQHGLGETEYSLRLLPIGGFVKMLGQDDVDPTYTSKDPRSYNMCSVPKRMVVVSAGVIMNLILAAVLFIIAFMVGVKLEAPVIGGVNPGSPAALAQATNAEALGVTSVGIQSGDRVLTVNGDDANTFVDLRIEAAMSAPEAPVLVEIVRDGVDGVLNFSVVPKKQSHDGLLGVGVTPAMSNVLDSGRVIDQALERLTLADSGVRGGMELIRANGQSLSTVNELSQIIDDSGGQPVVMEFQAIDESGERVGEVVQHTAGVSPTLQIYGPYDTEAHASFGLCGLLPLVRIGPLEESVNADVIKDGDLVLKFDTVVAPGYDEFMTLVQERDPGTVPMTVLRDGESVDITANVTTTGLFNRRSVMQIGVSHGTGTAYICAPNSALTLDAAKDGENPAAALDILPASLVMQIGDTPVIDFATMRAALLAATSDAFDADAGASVPITVSHATAGTETKTLELSAAMVADLHGLRWDSDIPTYLFKPEYIVRDAGGNPITAIVMGVEETHKTIVMTYLTIHRLFVGSVGVKQLRGPVGIIDLGAKIAPKGFMYLLFFLGLISVNLAVINFLPLPIVDGGLFLFLIYEKFKGKPPSPAFQNAAVIVGLGLIVTAFVVVTWNDVARLVG